jgi:hypothetical protein
LVETIGPSSYTKPLTRLVADARKPRSATDAGAAKAGDVSAWRAR